MKKMLFLIVCSALFLAACETNEDDLDHHRHAAYCGGDIYDQSDYGYLRPFLRSFERVYPDNYYPDTTVTKERAYVSPGAGVRRYRY